VGAELREQLMAALRAQFRPEFLNRVDDVVIFHGLTEEQLVEIVEIQLARLKKLVADRHMTIEFSDAAKRELARRGFDPVYGARPLKRVIQRDVVDPLAVRILNGDFTDGDAIRADLNGETVRFEKA
jgi:ATP-dependent Clp protease ATP-binding subunit ClpB